MICEIQVNDAFTGTTRLLGAGEDVYWLKKEFTANGKTYPVGAIYIPAKASTAALLNTLSKELGLTFDGTVAKPQGEALKLRPVRVGLWDRYGGSQDSGQIRWMLAQSFPTPYELVYASALDAGNLKSKYDVLIFPDGALPGGEGRGGRGGARGGGQASLPDEYRNQIGNVSVATTGPQTASVRRRRRNGAGHRQFDRRVWGKCITPALRRFSVVDAGARGSVPRDREGL